MNTTLLTIFIACVGLTLLVNSAILFMLYKTLNTVATKAEQSVKQLDENMPWRQWLASMQTTTAEAARVSSVINDYLASSGPRLEKFRAAYSKSLSKADGRLNFAFRAARFTAGATQGVVTWPIRNVQAAASAIKGMIEFIRGSENGADAKPRPNE